MKSPSPQPLWPFRWPILIILLGVMDMGSDFYQRMERFPNSDLLTSVGLRFVLWSIVAGLIALRVFWKNRRARLALTATHEHLSESPSLSAETLPQFALPKFLLITISIALIGVALWNYAALNFLVPLLLTVTAWAIISKTFPAMLRPLLPALAIQSGQLGNFVLLFLLWNQFDMFFDVLVLLIGLTVLILWPGRWPVLFLAIYQVLGILINGWAMTEVNLAEGFGQSLVILLVTRIAALFFLITGFRAYTSQSSSLTLHNPTPVSSSIN